MEGCLNSDSVLLGAVGGPKWDTLPGNLRPEKALLGIRAAMGLFTNLRPAKLYPALKESGISLVIARSFARIFYRNSINIGLAILECSEAVDGISEGDSVEADFDSGVIYNKTTGKSFQAQPFPEFIQKLLKAGGLVAAIRSGEIK